MPIVTVELVGDGTGPGESSLAQSIADAVAGVIGCGPGQTWVRVHWLQRENYAENNAIMSGELPVFVRILMRSSPVGDALEAQVSALTHAIADVVDRPANLVHLEYEPAAAGRVSFGGTLVR